jgi:hypothetical protein
METKSSEMRIISEKSIGFREFDIDEGFIKGTILFIDGSMLELYNGVFKRRDQAKI